MKLNITDKLQLEKPVLEIGEHSFVVNNSKDAMLAFEEKQRNMPDGTTNIEMAEAIIRHFLGEDAAAEIETMQLTVGGYMKVLTAVLALAGEEDFDEVEARFHRKTEAPAEPAVV